ELFFNPQRLLRYSRGDIVFLDFGFNVGTEFGGLHWAVVIEDNPKTSGNVTVVPLSSLDKNKSIENLHRGEVYLGYIQGPGKQLPTYAKVNQIRAVSKIRIYKPKRVSDGLYRLTNEQLDKIDEDNPINP
ncbi:MAG: type II toxin-antitoxin system PemK/MazF family toxin, partial [Moorella sp. (in: Bacteria)]|nr:type II toxin-antitoxin system PemK/MazF family toxin [Moorella sp. (in: firmicutes)]